MTPPLNIVLGRGRKMHSPRLRGARPNSECTWHEQRGNVTRRPGCALPAVAQCLNPSTAPISGLCPWMRVGLGCDEKHFPQPRQRAEMAMEPRGTNGQDQACVADLVAIANTVESQDLVTGQAPDRTGICRCRQAGRRTFRRGAKRFAINSPRRLTRSRPTAKQFLDELIIWLDREHLGRGIRT